ncbi:MAG: TldD/PmbA family protein [Clostridiales bacterium]|jgi:TldD protein|nr:TldD/PmbA family protein [Clostridiales bacterium]
MLSDLISENKKHFKDHTELRAQENTTKRVTLLAGNMVSNAQSKKGGVSARVYRGGIYGFASGAEYTRESVKNVLAAATENAIFMDSNIKKGEPPLPRIENAPAKIELQKPIFEDIPQSVLIDYAHALDRLIEKKYKNLSSRTIVADALYKEKLLTVSDGTDSHMFQPRAMVYAWLTAETSDGVPVDLFESFSHVGRFDEFFKKPEALEEQLDKLYAALMDKREGVYANAGLRKCVLHPDLAGMLSHEAVGHTVEADLVLGGSVAAYNLGKQVASELVSMTDFAHTALGKTCPLPVYVDDEGVPAEDAKLIENGILVGYMHNRESARHFGVKPQGNARAFEFSDEPLIRMRNTAILPGKDKLEDLIASVDDGYYLVKTGNGQADSTGEFMFSVDLGYEIKNGKLGKAIRETTISGVAFEMLKTVDMVSDDMAWEISGFCGKKQSMTTSMGGPALRCDMNIGGR